MITLTAIEGLPEIGPGDPLAGLIADRIQALGVPLLDGDVLVVSQKVVSKSEDRFALLDAVEVTDQAREVAALCGKDPRFVAAVLQESERIVRVVDGVLIVRNRLGLVMANAGIDQSNIEGAGDRVLLLPVDPDASAAAIREAVRLQRQRSIGVVIADSSGRAWRNGVTSICIGSSGIMTLEDCRGHVDRFGRELKVTQVAVGDQLAAAAGMVLGEADEGIPVVLVSGLPAKWHGGPATATDLVRLPERDLFL